MQKWTILMKCVGDDYYFLYPPSLGRRSSGYVFNSKEKAQRMVRRLKKYGQTNDADLIVANFAHDELNVE